MNTIACPETALGSTTLSSTRQTLTNKDIDCHVGERLRAFRQLTNLTQTRLAESLEISFQQIQKYESGSNRLSASRLYRAAQNFGVTPDAFFHGLPPTTDGAPPFFLSTEELNVIYALRRVSPPQRAALLGILSTCV